MISEKNKYIFDELKYSIIADCYSIKAKYIRAYLDQMNYLAESKADDENIISLFDECDEMEKIIDAISKSIENMIDEVSKTIRNIDLADKAIKEDNKDET